MSVFSDLKTAEYRLSGHPEAPERVSKTYARLKSAGHAILLPDVAAQDPDALRAHSPAHLKSLRAGTFLDADTPAYPGIDKTAFVSLSGALSAAESAAQGRPAFSLMRPPGHHAGRDRISGFCYLNNLACAVFRLLEEKKAARVAIVDVDVHHGDGTQELVLGKDGIHFVSLHQAPLYPGTGLRSEKNCENLPLPEGTTEGPYLKTLDAALGRLLDLKPDFLAVSAGFDTYKECPIAGLKLDKPAYRRIGALLAGTKLKRFAVLEGGYAADLPILVENFLEGFF
jgi:acetoin utilization deacetylase AcuC-like enzyme